MSNFRIKELDEQRADKIAELSQITEKSEAEKRSLNAVEKDAFDKVKAEIATIDFRKATLKEVDSIRGESESKAEKRDVRQSFNQKVETAEVKNNGATDFLRSAKKGDYSDFATGLTPHELRTVVKGSNVIGKQDFSSNIIQTAASYAGVLGNGADIVYTSNGNDFPMFVAADASVSGELIAENTDAAGADVSYSIKTLKAYKMGSKEIILSQEMIDDAGFDVEAFVASAAGERIGRITNTYLTTGTGSSQPQGIVTGAATGKTAASATTFTYVELLDLFHSVDPAYRNDPSFRFMFNDTVAAFLRKMVDGAGRYIWEAGRAGEPDLILGKQYVINNAMDSAFTTGKKLVVCGAFNRYKARIVNSIRVKRSDQRDMKADNVVFYATMRVDGLLSDTTAVKKLVLA